MKIISYIFLIKLFLITNGYAQDNLVANGSFELNKGVPTKDGDFSKVVSWFNPSANFKDNFNHGTPDYFHLNGMGETKIPYTKMGTVFASSGKACVGLISYTNHDETISNFREYIAIKLKDDLKRGKQYTLKISYTNGSDNQYGFYETQNLGIGFFKNKPIQKGYQPLKADYVAELDSLKYELDWVNRQMTFVAKGNFKYLVIGNFKKDINTSVVKSEIANSNSKFAYLFLDDIYLNETKKTDEEFADSLLKGKTLILDLHFKADSSRIEKRHYAELNKITRFLKSYSEITVEISGHTNSRPNHKYCDSLSSRRANSIKKYLISKGILPKQIITKGYGKRKPIASNTTLSGRRKNQRVEIKLNKI
jgi:outer membrane protein OmpA-like peptidoglycan-associated protein